MKKYIKEQLIEWMFKQPDDRPVDMSTGYNKGCGCLITQFLRSESVEFNHARVSGHFTLGDEIVGEIDLGDIIILDLFECKANTVRKNFGDLKRFYTPKKD
jgi:hypothetical protein